MNRVANIGNTLDIIRKYDFTFQKKYGQNFLTDNNIIDKIMDAAELTREDHVIEIGPGIGSMTQHLCERAGRVSVIEIDRELIPILNETLKDYDNVRIINDDVLKTDINAIIEESGLKSSKVVANLPYYITTPIVMGLLEDHIPVKSITIMVQREVADRMQAGPGTKDYGALSLAVQYYSKPHIVANVPPECFIPRPKVGSSVICLDIYDDRPVKAGNEALLFRLIRASFNQRRKTLTNSISNAPDLKYTKQDVLTALKGMNLPETIRGEALTLEQFCELSEGLNF